MPECSIEGESCGFKCSGWDGSEYWAKLHKVVQDIPCELCREDAIPNMSGFHDFVNVGLGKEPYDPKNFKDFAHRVKCAYDRCKAEGHCS